MANDMYYHIEDDIAEHPECTTFFVIGGRKRGKTYSTLKAALVNSIPFVFVKRTIEDVDILCAGSGKIGTKQNEFGVDLSPFRAINRDMKTDVRAYSIKKGIGGFWQHIDGEPVGSPIGYILALNAVSKYKGFDLSTSTDNEWLIFDEFIPNIYDRVSRQEGKQVLDLYLTISRDREERGLNALKLICLANATNIANPIMQEFGIVDTIAEMQARGIHKICLEDRGILVNQIEDNPEFLSKEQQTSIYKMMDGTAWADMSFGNKFAYNDFSCIAKVSLKGYKPVCSIRIREKSYFIYMKEGCYYMTASAFSDRTKPSYNLEKESDQGLFWSEQGLDLRAETIDGKMLFQTYTMYDLIMNYKKYYKI